MFLVRARRYLNDDLARAMVVHDLELPDVAFASNLYDTIQKQASSMWSQFIASLNLESESKLDIPRMKIDSLLHSSEK